MSLTVASFVIAALSLVLAAMVLIIGQPSDANKGTRRLIGATFILGGILFGFIGLFSLVGNDDQNSSTAILQTQVAVQATLLVQQEQMAESGSDSQIALSQDESGSNCAFLQTEHIDQLRLASSVSDAIRLAEDYAGHLQNDYRSDETIPTGVIIATDLQNADISIFPVSPIKNQGGWGLFITTDEFVAPNDGTYWCIR